MSLQSVVHLFVDASSEVPFGGSCSLVTHLLRRSLEQRDIRCEETLVRPPRLDAHGVLLAAERAWVLPSAADRLLFFEEVFRRADFRAQSDRERACVFFNLMCFGDEDVGAYAGARALLFNSPFLMRVFMAHVCDPGHPARLEAFSSTHFAACPLVLPAACFPEGYASKGEELSGAELARLTRCHVLGHALRPGLDPVAAVAIADALRRVLPSDRPPLIVVLRPQWQELLEAAEALGLPAVDSLFLPVARLNNASLLNLMKHSDFGLAYDRSIEAFGFYAVEAVWSGTPLYTNGAGNLRHLLPPGLGIECHESTAMAFGDTPAVLEAYAAVARRIASDVQSGAAKQRCDEGRAELLRRYGFDAFARRVRTALFSGTPNAPTNTGTAALKLHPLVRTCDLDAGRIITDEAAIQLDETARRTLRTALQSGKLANDDFLSSLLRHHLLAARIDSWPGDLSPCG